jgi:hypothetical protein
MKIIKLLKLKKKNWLVDVYLKTDLEKPIFENLKWFYENDKIFEIEKEKENWIIEIIEEQYCDIMRQKK